MIALKSPKTTAAAGIMMVVLYGGFELNKRSLDTLAPTSPRMQAVAKCAATTPIKLNGKKVTFVVYHGYRTEEEQRAMIAKAVSWVNRSRHQDGQAIDVMAQIDGKGTWEAAPYYEIANAFYKCGNQLSIPITWGGEWRVQDMVHFEEKR